MRIRPTAATLASVVALAVTPAAAASASASASPSPSLSIEVLSSRPEWVSDGDALVRVGGARGTITVTLNGEPVSLPAVADGSLTGLVSGLRPGPNEVRASASHERPARVVLINHPRSGPIFSGPHQYPFLCRTAAAGLGPAHRGQSGRQGSSRRARRRQRLGGPAGARLHRADRRGSPCTGRRMAPFKPMPADGSRPADLATTTTFDGRTVDYIVDASGVSTASSTP